MKPREVGENKRRSQKERVGVCVCACKCVCECKCVCGGDLIRCPGERVKKKGGSERKLKGVIMNHTFSLFSSIVCFEAISSSVELSLS